MIKAKVFLVLSILLASCSGNDSNNMVPSSLPNNPSNVTASTNVSGSVIANDLDISFNDLFCPVSNCDVVYDNEEFPSFRKIFFRLEFTVLNKTNTNQPLSISIKIPNSSDIQIINKTHNSGAPVPNIPTQGVPELINGRFVEVITITGISYTAQPGIGSFFYVFEITGLSETPDNVLEYSFVNRVINNQMILLRPVTFRFVGSIPKLVQPTLIIIGNEVRWNHSSLTFPRYDVQINNEEKQISLNTNKISIDHLASGNHTIKVTSKGDGFTFRNSDESILNFSRISAPTVVNSIINNEKMISWQAISGATSYEISNGISKRQTNDLTIKLTDVISTEGTFNLSVISMSSTQNIAQSSQSNVIVAIKLNAPIINKINAGLIRWSEVPNATGYIVINNGIVSETITSLEWNLRSGPNSNVQVMAISSLPNVLDSGWSNNINYNLG